MATIQKRGDKYRAIVRKRGYTQTATFTRRRDAEAWAREVEVAIENGTLEAYDKLSFGDVLRRYLVEVPPTKKSARGEKLRLEAFLRDFPFLAQRSVEEFSRRDVAFWRDRRRLSVSDGSVNREWNTLSAAWTHAARVWGLALPQNPFRLVVRPAAATSRNQRISAEVAQAIIEALGYDGQRPPKRQSEKVAWAFLFAIETAMRCGEICKLTAEDIRDGIAHLRETKNGTDRFVPLSPEARRLLALVELPLGITPGQVDALFRKYRPAESAHIHFHDTRHEALSRMTQRIHNPMTLAKISGHKDVKILLNTYYNPQGEDLAGLLD